jgi:hypothetical protein
MGFNSGLKGLNCLQCPSDRLEILESPFSFLRRILVFRVVLYVVTHSTVWYMSANVFAKLAVSGFSVGFGPKLKTNDERLLVVLTTSF